MDTFNDYSLSAYFPGLIDVCIDEDGHLVYAILKDGEIAFVTEYVTEKGSCSIPEKKHFPFTLPRADEVVRYFGQKDTTLYDDLLLYLKRFSALDDKQWALIVHWIFLTYLHDHPGIDYCPYILFNAVPERGKSRTGKSIVNVAFRGIHLIEMREPTIFRYSQYLHGTLFFDLLNVSKKAERGGCEDILLLRYEKGAKCNRVQRPDEGPFKDMVYYDIYGPTIISSNEPSDKILETRCLPINMPNRPGNYESPRPESALELKERLTAWRAKNMTAEFTDLTPMEAISGRLWDITKPLFLVNSLVQVDEYTLKDAILAIAGEKEASRKDSIEGQLVAIIRDLTKEGGLESLGEWSIPIHEIRSKFNEGRPDDRHATPQWVGKRLKNMSFQHRNIRGHSEIVLTSSEYALILKQYGYDNVVSAKTANCQPHTLPENFEQNQPALGEVESGRESAQVENHLSLTPLEEKELEEERQAIQEEAQISWDEGEEQDDITF